MAFSLGIPTKYIVGASGLEHMYYTYVLQSEKDGSYYIGSTNNIEARLKKHNSGGSKYTKSKLTCKLVYKEECQSLSEARKREYYLKSLKSRKYIEKLIKGAIV